MAGAASQPLGLIAGTGELPLAVVHTARERGRPVVAIAFHGQTEPSLEEHAAVTWLHPGEVGAAVAALRAAGVSEAVMAGKVPKVDLVAEPGALKLDAAGLEVLRGLGDRGDDSILGAVADHLERQGIRLLPQADWVPELVGGAGVLGAVAPSEAQRADVAFALPLAKAVAGLDIGQTLVVKDGAVLAVEAIEGTDAAIRRAGEIASGACVVKVAKPSQDPRFDVPTVGPGTLAAMVEAKAAVLAYEAGCTLVLNRDRLVSEADARGIALLGIAAGEGA